ncbi:hypothetical protein A3D80_00700 [Candidatus Roizmanbacteria bacterium RIFCSPHIGHO2_02_FULL_40_13b]|uniref:MBL fold metallo-hydrolase n=1 Tax=Candidatus Roizmanbacteria bacterium RIFCSPHIGHO2_01_FULL_39_24 TaxID=1802032 RepID=A0A1F7GL45_9BACT|nr:MAG: hypothetical protein A2799_02665 [Candidatus Roizmanbacteria bacterium RIFCSPHIGHO2_01_FULL_39_24]OGK27464.1 MAG: hypothetical protein A3D80_00700 [Candidatus Roizmanbacteria bacterium RIFCSPHIGHO2_02_FULL_40_13b]OGK56134.1 MAG: hypothetical protein A3H83_02350 [Candidatus Roizmanbacteria bacterium RIFCSPLOWO2_02_FULL_39_8]
MDSIRFLGAAGTVTGSSYVLKKENTPGILVDLGMFQGPPEIDDLNRAQLKLVPQDIEAVVLTHAHLDHCGRLPLLSKMGFTGKIYMTAATRALYEITLLDAAHIAQNNEDREPLYTERDVRYLFDLAEIVEYGSSFTIGDYFLELFDAGHILGSASVKIENVALGNKSGVVVFSGDLGNSPEELLHATETIPKADVVIMESTYGDRIHPNEDTTAMLQNEINIIEKTGASLLIPAFSIERSQELLHKIDHLKKQKLVKDSTPVFLDSPMAIKTTEVYKQFKELYSPELSDHTKTDDPFDFPGLKLVEKVDQSKKISATYGPKVIIAGSGMMSGGRIMYHALEYLPYRTTRLFIVGYQGEGTLGREILDGGRIVTIMDRKIQVNATVTHASGMSAHADQSKLLSWFNKIADVKKLILTHGEDTSRTVLKEKVNEKNPSLEVYMPHMNETISLI